MMEIKLIGTNAELWKDGVLVWRMGLGVFDDALRAYGKGMFE